MKTTTLDSFPADLDSVALESPHATFYHSGVWLHSVAAAYPRLSLRCIVAEDGGRPVGYLPYFVSRRGPLARAWSLPFGTYGGPACIDDEAAPILLDAFARVLGRGGVVETGWVDFRNLTRADAPETWYETHLVDLTVGFDRLFEERFATQRRQRVRRARKLGVSVRRVEDEDGLGEYYRIFRDRIAGFGGPSLYHEALYRELFGRGKDTVRLYMAYLDDAVVGGHLNFCYKDTVIAWYGVVAGQHQRTQAGTLLYAVCMQEACEEGFATYNLGASLNKASLIHFKESLGGVAHRYPVHVTRSLLGRVIRALRTGGSR
jgi:CelD/BcsL family acetyltransferase involved in cellulose biosynthesis